MNRTSRPYSAVFSLLFLFFICANFLFLFLGMKFAVNFSNSNNQIFDAYSCVNVIFIMILPAFLILLFSFSPFAPVSNLFLDFFVSFTLGFLGVFCVLGSEKLTFKIFAFCFVLALYFISLVYLSYLSSRFSVIMIVKDMSLKFALKSGKAGLLLLKFSPGLLLLTLCSILIGCFY